MSRWSDSMAIDKAVLPSWNRYRGDIVIIDLGARDSTFTQGIVKVGENGTSG